jgi:hypothetical protein
MLRRGFAILLELLTAGGLVMIGVELLHWQRAPFAPTFILATLAVLMAVKIVFELKHGLLHEIGVRMGGPGAQWDTAILGALYRRRAKIALLVLTTLVGLAFLEAGLRASLRILPVGLANALALVYSINSDGIYRFDYDLRLPRMRPHYQRMMYFNGYTWNHWADAMGFRNPTELMQADVVLLGDSLIYGHGVEETQTVASHLRRLTNRSVANLGQQGSGMHQEYQFLLHVGRALRPKWVFLFVFNNDLTDTTQALTQLEQQRFIEIPDGRFDLTYVDRRPPPRQRIGHALQDWTGYLYVIRAVRFGYDALTKSRLTSLHPRAQSAANIQSGIDLPNPPGGVTPAPINLDNVEGVLRQEPFLSEPELVLSYRFQLKGFRQMQQVAKQDGFQFAVIYLDTNQPFDEIFDRLCEKGCRSEGISYVSLRDYYRRRQDDGAELFLKNDGHLTDTGAGLTAEELLRQFPMLKSNPSETPSR